jgi:hypothetical protein
MSPNSLPSPCLASPSVTPRCDAHYRLPASRLRTSNRYTDNLHSLNAAKYSKLLSCGAFAGATVFVPLFWAGGFPAGAQVALIVGAGLTLVAAIGACRVRALSLMRSPPVAILAGLAVLTAVSSAWTIVGAGVAIRSGLLVASYGALAVSAGVLKSGGRWGLTLLVLIVAVAAGVEEVIGIVAACLHHSPQAAWIGGAWRPAGTFEYPPALALLAAMSLPLLVSRVGRGLAITLSAGIAATLAGTVLGAAGERLEIVLAAVALVALILTARSPTLRVGAIDTAALVTIGAVTGRLVVAHGTAATSASRPGALIVQLGLCLLAPVLWPRLRERAGPLFTGRRQRLATVTLVVTLVVAAAVGIAGGTRSGSASNLAGGITHARTGEWHAAVETWLHRPVLGSGAGSYLFASLPYQGVNPVLYPHDLPLELAAELGILGLVLGICLYVAVPWALWLARRDPAAWLLGPAVAMFLISNLVDWTWHLSALTAIWALCLGSLLPAQPQPHPLDPGEG